MTHEEGNPAVRGLLGLQYRLSPSLNLGARLGMEAEALHDINALIEIRTILITLRDSHPCQATHEIIQKRRSEDDIFYQKIFAEAGVQPDMTFDEKLAVLGFPPFPVNIKAISVTRDNRADNQEKWLRWGLQCSNPELRRLNNKEFVEQLLIPTPPVQGDCVMLSPNANGEAREKAALDEYHGTDLVVGVVVSEATCMHQLGDATTATTSRPVAGDHVVLSQNASQKARDRKALKGHMVVGHVIEDDKSNQPFKVRGPESCRTSGGAATSSWYREKDIAVAMSISKSKEFKVVTYRRGPVTGDFAVHSWYNENEIVVVNEEIPLSLQRIANLVKEIRDPAIRNIEILQERNLVYCGGKTVGTSWKLVGPSFSFQSDGTEDPSYRVLCSEIDEELKCPYISYQRSKGRRGIVKQDDHEWSKKIDFLTELIAVVEENTYPDGIPGQLAPGGYRTWREMITSTLDKEKQDLIRQKQDVTREAVVAGPHWTQCGFYGNH